MSRDSRERVLELHVGNEKYVVRDWTPEDREPLVKIVQDILISVRGQLQPEGRDRDLLHVEEYYWKNERGEFFTIEDTTNEADSKVVGCAGYYDVSTARGEPSVEVRKMYLKPEARGKGIARAALAMLEERIRRKGFKTIFLHTHSKLTRARRLWEAAGYANSPGFITAGDTLLKKTLD